ncbi:MAG TPA: twin-arginine translocase TatA/TatE family subunit [Acidobacteriaceae bacterium]|nr:twin-arginine translocase TatA/TatE family subunit [Acidobacteriaceae bacterium]
MMISQDPILYSSLGVGDTIVLFLLALVVFGPKRLPEIGRQIGKIYGEFRRASNEFKFQIEDELRKAEETEKQKKLEAEPAAAQMPAAPQILPPSTGQIIAQRESSLHENPLPIGESVEEPRVADDNLETVRTHEEVQR